MTHDVLPDGTCSCGRVKACPVCDASLVMIGYDSDPRHGFGHIWGECTNCPQR